MLCRLLPRAVLVLALVAACSERRATQYVGTAMNEATPDAEGSFRLTLYSWSDSSFSGVVELGAPLHGSGRAWVWPEGSALSIESVGTATGDTIRWVSRLTGRELGGRFDVIGGPRTGQRGTWRARLVDGPVATLATLRTRRGMLLPRPSAFLPIPLLIVLALLLWRWVLSAPRSPVADGGAWRAPSARVAGIGGWLVVFTVLVALASLIWIVRFATPATWHVRGFGLGAAIPGLQPTIVLERAVSLVQGPLMLVGLYLVARRSPYAPRFWFAYLTALAAYASFDIVAGLAINRATVRLIPADSYSATPGESARAQNVRTAVWSLVWALYWIRSRRVRATFGAAALDTSVTAPVVAPALAATEGMARPDDTPQPPRAGRRWLRIAGWTVVGLVGVAAALLAYGLSVTRATPYDVPNGTDIRRVLAGRWTWASDSAGCADAHTIAFDDRAHIMTITSGTFTASDPVTTYDIRRITRSSIRGAIRGETRKTSDGKPVVWDLVLTGPDEYRWHRTDWSDTPWSYTGAIHRCPAAPTAVTTPFTTTP